MDIAYVLDNQGNPLMPTKRLGRVRHLLQEDKAEIACYKPFTIQLKYESTHFVQDLYVGIDPGRTNIGLAVVNGKGEVFMRLMSLRVTEKSLSWWQTVRNIVKTLVEDSD